MNDTPARRTLAGDIAARTDAYFNRTRQVVQRFGDKRVTYAVFMRRPVVFAPRLALDLLEQAAAERGVVFEIEKCHDEGAWVGAGEPMLYITGSLQHLVPLHSDYDSLTG